jgi:hypothetical protein
MMMVLVMVIILPRFSGDNDNDKPIKSLLKGKGLLPLVGLSRYLAYFTIIFPVYIFSPKYLSRGLVSLLCHSGGACMLK